MCSPVGLLQTTHVGELAGQTTYEGKEQAWTSLRDSPSKPHAHVDVLCVNKQYVFVVVAFSARECCAQSS